MHHHRARPVKWQDFRQVLLKTLGASSPTVVRLGVAISGGVDSMALASLCSTLQETEPSVFSFKAFVVDHRARTGSDDECKLVTARLRDLRLCHRIIRLDWGVTTNPLSLGNFESRARRLRYRALGQACLDENLQALLLGHHADDQAETVMMRMLEKRYGLGLHAMRAVAPFPECSDIHGLGSSTSWPPTFQPGACLDKRRFNYTKILHTLDIPICRPLLGYYKEDLAATCVSASVPWVEDETNHDRTLTLRNTVRYLLQEQDLPLAIQKRSLLDLSDVRRARCGEERARAFDRLQMYDACTLDIRSGVLLFHVPKFLTGSGPKIGERASLSLSEYFILVDVVCSLVSPQAATGHNVLKQIAKKLFQTAQDSQGHGNSTSTNRAFTAGLLKWSVHTEDHRNTTWIVSRQPPSKREQLLSHLWKVGPAGQFERPQLFDGRFWIRVFSKRSNLQDLSVKIRFLRTDDMDPFERALESDGERRMLRRVLKDAAPGGIRWTLPAVVEPLSDQVLALPTLGFMTPTARAYSSYSVEYKGIKP